MKFPSLFRLPSSQQFEIKPRYYDPVKEFVEQRRSLVNSKHGKGEKSRITFERRKTSAGMGTSLLQLIIAVVLGSMIVGWLFIGNDIFYFGLILVPFYFYFRIRKK